MKFVVYDPPVFGFPFLAVVLDADNKVMHVEAHDTAFEAEEASARWAQEIAAKVAGDGSTVRRG